MPDDGDRGRHPTWVRAVLVGLQVVGIVVGLVVGTMTYQAWSEPEPVGPAPSTTLVAPEPPAPADPLG